MSLGYAEKLSFREDVGEVGMSEFFDPPHVLQRKIEELAVLIKKSKHLVAFTGAGISTSCGIPDFRGPKGIWTLQKEGKDLPGASLPFHRAMPGITHMALVLLEKAGILKFVISQNVDSLHLRSGIPREKLAELHGNSFREICPSCGKEYLRDFEIETIGLKHTSRRCSDSNCGSKLRDTVLDWEDALPPKEMNLAEKHCRAADIVLCLGTSLQITPACNLPLKTIKGGGKIVIVNLQRTPKDKNASLVIHGLVDKVMTGVMDLLNHPIPPFVRVDFVQLSLSQGAKYRSYAQYTFRVSSTHGLKAPLPFIESVEVSFPDRPDLKTVFLRKQPFCLKRGVARRKPFVMALKFNFSDGCGSSCATVEFPVDFQVKKDSFTHDKTEVLQRLKDEAALEPRCGRYALVERNAVSRYEVTIIAMVTNVVTFKDVGTKQEKEAVPANNDKSIRPIKDSEGGGGTSPKRSKLS